MRRRRVDSDARARSDIHGGPKFASIINLDRRYSHLVNCLIYSFLLQCVADLKTEISSFVVSQLKKFGFLKVSKKLFFLIERFIITKYFLILMAKNIVFF